MQKRFEDKRWGLAIVFFALISLVLLVGTLRGLDFRPAQLIGGSRDSETANFPKIGEIFVNVGEIPLWKQFVFWGGLFLIVLLISALLTPELRKRLIIMFLRMAASILVLYYFLKENPDILSSLLQQFSSLDQIGSDASQAQEIVPPVFQPPQISSFLSFLIAFGVVLFAILLFWTLSRWWVKHKQLISRQKPLTEIAAIARASLKDIASGQNSNDAIIQCYERMSNVVGAKRGLRREHAMTPTEFASRLERAGVPRGPILRLTRLFESVRYGGHASGQPEIDEAVACLTSILKYCGETL